MSHAHKMDVTRPKFLLHLMGNDIDQLTDDTMRRPLCESNVLSYCAYTVLMEADLKESKIDKITEDGEAVAVRFKKSVDVQHIGAQCQDTQVRYGNKKYTVQTKVRDRYLILSIDEGVEIA
ncbi:MAG: hypothetical protein NC489_08380 [Ruminococcus flavefaciens]|nr:hypothetical protein [Ruminococcus flavefaciens]